MPRHPAEWYMICIISSLALLIILGWPVFGRGDEVSTLVTWVFLGPGMGLFVYTAFKGQSIFHTYGSQKVNSITISDGTVSIEILDESKGGFLRWYTALFGRPIREKVIDNLTIPFGAIRGYMDYAEQVNDEIFHLFVIFVASMNEADEEEELLIPITPRFRKEQDALDCLAILAPYLPDVEEYHGEKPSDYDPSYA